MFFSFLARRSPVDLLEQAPSVGRGNNVPSHGVETANQGAKIILGVETASQAHHQLRFTPPLAAFVSP
jgi:hypothetical protein